MIQKRILIVDDELELQDLMCQVFECNGWQVFRAEGSVAAWDLWQNLPEKPAIALLDMNISGPNDGLALAEKLKISEPSVHIIISSGYFDPDFQYPHDFSYIEKPFRLTNLLAACNNALSQYNVEHQPLSMC